MGTLQLETSSSGSEACPSFVAAGRTFAVYVTHLGKSRLLLGPETRWKTKAVTTVGHGPAKAGDGSFSPRAAASREQLIEIVTASGWGDGSAIAALTSWAFFLRIPPGYLPSTIPRVGEDILPEERL